MFGVSVVQLCYTPLGPGLCWGSLLLLASSHTGVVTAPFHFLGLSSLWLSLAQACWEISSSHIPVPLVFPLPCSPSEFCKPQK